MIHKLALTAFLLTFTLTVAPRAEAQWVSTNGPPGVVNEFVPVGNTLFAGGSSGVFFLNDGDTSWTDANLDVFIGALLLSNGTLIAGTPNGIFLANGLDTSWNQSNDSQYVFALAAIGPNLFAGTLNGVFISNDNGNTWNPTNYEYNAFAMAAVGTNLFIGDNDGGVSVSPDNGNTWNPVDSGLPLKDIHVLTASGNELFAGANFDAGGTGGLFRTTNNGAIWTRVNGLPDTAAINAIFVNGSYLFAGTDSDVFLSTDNGVNWRDVSGALNDTIYPTSVSAYSFTVNDDTLYAGTQRGVWMSLLPFFLAVTPNAPTTTSLTSYPNPFADKTTINFLSPESGAVEVTVVNLLGSEVARIFDGELDAGQHEFSWDASTMPPGMYECIVRMNGQAERMPMVIVR